MKKSFSRIWGVGLVLVMLASLLFSAVPVAADELAWGKFKDPTDASNMIGPGGTAILDIAAASDGQTVYASSGLAETAPAANIVLYKSTNGGQSYSTITKITGVAGFVANLIAVAPDNKDVVAVADTGLLQVWVSTNGGSSWSNLTTAALTSTTINDLAISSLDGSKRYIGVAGTTAANNPDFFYFNLGSNVPAWVDAVAWAGGGFGPVTVDDIVAIAFSPYFSSDLTAVAVSADLGAALTTTGIRFHILSFNLQKWDLTAGFSGYPFYLEQGDGVGAIAYTKADISLDPAYLGGDDSLRIAFVALDATLGGVQLDGLFRLKDTSVKRLVLDTAMYSVSWNGTNLVAGPTVSTQVRKSADALSTDPSITSTSSLKRPGFDDAVAGTAENVVVRWAGAKVIAGTTSAVSDSAIAISADNAGSFDDVAAIDTVFTAVEDLWVSTDGSVVYLLTNNVAGTTSLWRKSGDNWARVWKIAGTAGYLIRGPMDNKDVLYIADTAATNMWYTDNGAGKWFPRASRYAIADLAVESADVAYVAESATANVSKTTNKGFTWGDAKGTSLGGGANYSITLLSKDNLIVGSTTGWVSYSTDGNANWTKIGTQLSQPDPVVVTADSLANDGYIYAATDGTTAITLVQRWKIGTSTSWKDLAPVIPAAYGSFGIALSEGVLFVSVTDGVTDTQIFRTLGPTGDTPGWSSTNVGVFFFNLIPNALRVSKGSTVLWGVATNTQDTYSYTDTLTVAKVVLAGPADASKVSVNLISGGVYSVSFSWTRLSKATSYDLQVALDSGFNETLTVAGSPVASTSDIVALSPALTLNPDTKYYWRVRVSSVGPVRSNWSDVRSFTIAKSDPTPPVVVTIPPPAPAPIINLPAPIINLPAPQQIVIPPPQQIIIPPAPAPPAPIAPAYIWAVVIIGAVLVIAVIILIVRTRRPV